jgi:hypothetical protein
MECIICYEDIIEKVKVALTCCHIYHTKCIVQLVKKRYRKCPLCRTKITWNIPQLNKHVELSKNK